MDSSKNRTPLTHSRGSSVCDYCGKTMNRHNFKRHTVEHHKGQPVKERIVGVLSVTNFFQSISNITNKNSEEDNETQDPEVVDNDVMKEIEQHVENDQYTLKDMKEHIEKNHIEVMNEIAIMKKKCNWCHKEKKCYSQEMH